MFYDFLNYLIYKFYAKAKEKGAVSTAAAIVGGFQAANVLTLIMLFEFTQKQKFRIEKWIIIVLFLVFQITTYIRYIYKDNHSINVIENEWINKTPSWQKKMTMWLYIYGAGSVLALFGLAIYLGSTR